VEEKEGLESDTGEMGQGQTAGRIYSLRSKVIRSWLSYSTQQAFRWEPNRFSVSQEIPRILRNPEGSLPHSHVPTTCLYPEPDQSNPCPIPFPKDTY